MQPFSCRRWWMVALAVPLVPAVLPAQPSCKPVNIVRDGGFEQAAGTPPESPDWTAASTGFGSPVCDSGSCAGRGTGAALGGGYWTLFGGTSAPGGENASLAQTLTLPVATAVTLEFELWISDVAEPLTDTLAVRVDGVARMAIDEPAVPETGYSLRTFVLDEYADGAPHTIEFEFIGPDGGGLAAFNVDDVRIVARQVVGFADGSFEDAVGDPLDSPAWVEASVQYGSPLCTLALCGDGSGTVSPRTGLTWTWFGGVGGSTPETSSVRQIVRLPLGAYVDLEFYLGIGAVTAPFTDELAVRLDGEVVASFLEPKVADSFYTLRSAIVDPYADGQPHELLFEYVKGVDGNGANFSLDDIEFTEVDCLAILLDDFESHDFSNWSAVTP